MPVRKVTNRGGNVSGYFPSLKMGRMIMFESLIERDYLYLLDYDSQVSWFEEQPLTIKYRYHDKGIHYTPDFHLVEGGRNVLIECKPLAFVNQDENQRKFQIAQAWCAERAWLFRIVTDQNIRTGFRLENIKLLTRYARQVVAPRIKGRIYALLQSAEVTLSIDEIVRSIADATPAVTTRALLSMAFHHEISLAVDEAPILGNTAICLSPSHVRRSTYEC